MAVTQEKSDQFGLNETYVAILRAQWQNDPHSVTDEWRTYFTDQPKELQKNQPLPPKKNTEVKEPQEVEKKQKIVREPLVGVAKIIAENMAESLSVPTATSVRDIPAKVLEENRALINAYLQDEAYPKCSFTHLIAYALVKAAVLVPAMNNSFETDGKKAKKVIRQSVNLGLAIDLPGRDGSRILVVPNIKDAQDLDFRSFFEAYNAVIAKARAQKLTAQDFADTTITLTNTGGMGTVSSNPRLMSGQSAIVAVGRIGFPAAVEAATLSTLQSLGIGKSLTMTSTYDHRVIQGAESGRFLAYVHELLVGEHGFYNDVFTAIGIPHHPFKLSRDRAIMMGNDSQLAHTERAMAVAQLIHTYRVRGHLLANVDPLDLKPRIFAELELHNYGLTIWDLDREFFTLGVLPEKRAPLRNILARLRETYCRRMGVEYMYINDSEERKWLQSRVELESDNFSILEKKNALKKVLEAEGFEHFLHKRYVGHKRFSIEGAESAICVLNELLDSAASFSVTDVLIGMAHRGRLNVLANIVGKPYEAIFGEFDDLDPKSFQGTGDVKYHLGAKGVHRWRGESVEGGIDEREVRVELACNPSHLEAVDSVLEGQVRAKQDLSGDRNREKIVPILLHGDAAFSGQGIVYENLQLSNLRGYRTGGTIHLVVNNQIGYTTPPEKGRTSRNCTDLARAIGAPVFRVNGDDPEACMLAARTAYAYRMKYKRDVVIDLVCYRRHGHNEGDEPSFTQPILYAAIRKHRSVAMRYGALLVRRGDISEEKLQEIVDKHFERLDRALLDVREKGHEAYGDSHVLFSHQSLVKEEQEPITKVSKEILERIANKVTFEPNAIEIHPRVLKQVLERRRSMVLEGKPRIDFGMAEILAYGSLLQEGIPVRLSGQDSGRGTFAHRHAVLYDVNDGREYIPLNHLNKTLDEGEEVWTPSRFRVYDSPLSEEAVLGFEYGYSASHPTSLVIWEAQFGDFFNGAQVQVDQFIASSEAKWGQKSRVTMLLPHGYDGQGPEHSSARLERFLQLCAENNMRVANCSTSAQLFHLLRRQAKMPKKPLIVMSHKSLLRSDEAGSPIEALTEGAFNAVLPDITRAKGGKAKRVVFLSGKLYWDIARVRKEDPKASLHVEIVRVEEIYPFPLEKVLKIIEKYQPQEVVWAQEEPKNMGAFEFVRAIMIDSGIALRYVGRSAAASPATGSPKVHKREQSAIIEAILAPLKGK